MVGPLVKHRISLFIDCLAHRASGSRGPVAVLSSSHPVDSLTRLELSVPFVTLGAKLGVSMCEGRQTRGSRVFIIYQHRSSAHSAHLVMSQSP